MLVVGKRKMKISQMALRIVLILIFLRIFFYFLPLEFSNTDAQVFMRIGFNALIIVVFFIFYHFRALHLRGMPHDVAGKKQAQRIRLGRQGGLKKQQKKGKS